MNSPACAANLEKDRLQPPTDTEFDQIRRLAFDKFGLDLHRGKEYLVAARLGRVIRESRCRSFQEYYRHVLADGTGEDLETLADRLLATPRRTQHGDDIALVIARAGSAARPAGCEPYSSSSRDR